MLKIETLKAFFLLQEREQWILIFAIYLYFFELWKLGAKVKGAEVVNLLLGARSLVAKLVAREVQNLKTLVFIILIECLQFLLLWCKATTGSSIH